jgi:hypothetical protein
MMGRIGWPRNPIHVRNKRRELANLRGMPSDIASKSFTQSWFSEFMKRNKQQISIRKTQAFEKSRAELTSEDVRPFYTVLDAIFKEHPIMLQEPSRVSNLDESGRLLDVFQRTGIFEKGQQSAHSCVTGNREHCSLLAHIKADRTAFPPCFIFQGKILAVGVLDGAPPGAGAWCQDNAWMDSPAFLRYLKEFYYPLAIKEGKVSAKKPLLLIFDGQKTHVTSEVIEFGLAHHIIIATVAPHSSHLSQPLDVRAFSALWSMCARTTSE